MSHADLPDFGTLRADPAWKIALIRSVWHPELTSALMSDAVAELVALGVEEKKISRVDAPGSYELPLLAKTAIEKGAHGVIVFGVIVQGATHHAELVADASAHGCMQAQLQTGRPVIYEVLFVDDIVDAKERSIGANGKGALAAKTLVTQLARIGEMH